jgi:hypothetical protein
MTIRRLIGAFIAAGIWSLAAHAQTTTTSTTRTFTFPPTGLGSTETAQVNAVNLASNTSNETAASCTGSISFVSAANVTLGSATSFTVTAGQIASIDLPFSKAAITGSRGEIRGVVQWTQTSSVPCSLEFSFETFDASSGATHIYLTGAAQNNVGPPQGGPGR